MQWAEGMLVSVGLNRSDSVRAEFEIIAFHPDGLVLKDSQGRVQSVLRETFDKGKPFPIGKVWQ